MPGINKIRVEVKRSNCPNPVFLQWFNKLGGVEHWLFDAAYGESWQTRDQVEANQYVAELDGFPNNVPRPTPNENFVEVLRKGSFEVLTLTANNLTRQQMRGLQGLTESVKVSMLLNPTDWDDCAGPGPIWETVIVQRGSFEFGDSDEGLFRLTFKISKQPKVIPWQ